MSMPGMWELIIIFGVVFLLFGAKKLPQLGGAIGESIKNFKKGVKENDKLTEGENKSDKPNDKTS
jgi:sec-independent protein translocase protein TatA